MAGEETGAGTPQQACDVMTFGAEVGRVLSDGRVVGRPEPFAKVFASSRLVKRAVGLTAWGVLEDIALDAALDAEGRLVAETSARRIAANLGLNKETVTRHLGRLREHGFVLHEEVRDGGSGRYETARYVLDPAACLERFTHTPRRDRAPCTENPDTANPVYGKAVHGSAGHGESVHPLLEEVVVVEDRQQQQPPLSPQARQLQRLGIDADTAAALAAEHSADRVAAVVAAVSQRRPRNPAGWAIAAFARGWALPGEYSPAMSAPAPARTAGAPPPAAVPASADSGVEVAREQRWQAWDTAVSAALDDDALARAIRLACRPLPGGRWVTPAVHAELIRWAAAASARVDGGDLAGALAAALDEGRCEAEAAVVDDLPAPPPAAASTAPGLRARLEGLLTALAPRQDGAPSADDRSPNPGGSR